MSVPNRSEPLGKLHEKLDHLGRLITAPVVVVRDADGKVTGTQRVIPEASVEVPPSLDEALEELSEIDWWGICFHEAGHAVVGIALGLKPMHADVRREGGAHGRVRFACSPYDQNFPWGKWAAMQAAGGVAQFKFLRDFRVDFDVEVIHAYCAGDNSRLITALTVGMSLSGDAFDKALTDVHVDVRRVLNDNWDRVMSVAYALHTFHKLDGLQLQFAFKHSYLARGGPDGARAAYDKLHAMIDAMAAPSVIHRDETGRVVGAQKQVGGR